MCSVCGDSLACLAARKSGRLVFFCPLCGVAYREPPPLWELEEILRLDELAPAGVALASRAELEVAGFADIEELGGTWMGWIEEVLWRPPGKGKTDEEATKAHFDRWYSR